MPDKNGNDTWGEACIAVGKLFLSLFSGSRRGTFPQPTSAPPPEIPRVERSETRNPGDAVRSSVSAPVLILLC